MHFGHGNNAASPDDANLGRENKKDEKEGKGQKQR